MTGEWYWHIILGGRGRELKREGDCVYFFWEGRHGWLYFWCSQRDIEEERTAGVRRYIGDWLRYRKSDDGKLQLDSWDRRQFESLTRYRFGKEDLPPVEWWNAHRNTFVPTPQQVAAFLQERESQMRLRLKMEKGLLDESEDPKYIELHQNRNLDHCFMYSEQADEAIRRWCRGQQRWWNFVFEAIYYPLFIFFASYVIPTVSLRLRRRGFPHSIRLAALFVLIHLGLVLPYAFGYSPYWMSTRSNQGTILYNIVLSILELPTLLCLSVLPEHLQYALAVISVPLDYLCFPVLARINEPGTPFASFSVSVGRGMIVLLGSIIYGLIGFLVGVRYSLKLRGKAG
jgi:hypothetical protein